MSKDAGTAVAELANALTQRIRDAAFSGSVDIKAHEAEMTRRREERAKKQPTLDLCLNAEYAGKLELEKERFEYTVKASWMADKRDDKGRSQGKQLVGHEAKVIALNENDAWARYCDSIGEWPGRKHCRDLTIVKGKQISVADYAASQLNQPYRVGY